MTMSRIRSNVVIFALTRNEATMQKVGLIRGVEPVVFDSTRMPKDYVNRSAVDELVKRKLVKDKELILLTSGDHMGVHGGTNKLKLVRVGEVV
jgi:pyruvate kinase